MKKLFYWKKMIRDYLGKITLLLCALAFSTGLALAQDSSPDSSSDSSSPETSVEPNPSVSPESPLDLNLVENLNVEHAVQNWESRLGKVLGQYGVNKSWFGKLVGSLAILLLIIIIGFVIRRIIKFLRVKSETLVIKYHLNRGRINFNFRIIQYFFRFALVVVALASLVTVWEVSLLSFIDMTSIYWVLQSVVSIFAVLILTSLILELAGGIVEKTFAKLGGESNTRMQTLLPIAKNLIFAIIITLFGLTLLSELGINVMPLLAGAGVVGFAIGFGAQAFVKDLITGFVIILEDLVQVGDVISVGGKTGLVEKITIRKIQLRNLEGIVSTVPFSEISIVDNYTKLFSYYLFNVGVAYRENTDEVVELLKQVDEDLRADEEFKNDILDSLEILGVDSFADSAVIIKARIKTFPIKQWRIGREFNRRMKLLFDEKNIEIPFPHQTIYFGEDKNGKAPALNVNYPFESSRPANDGQ